MPERSGTRRRRYIFHPLESRGLVLGFGPAQVALIGAGALVGVMIIRSAPPGIGFVAAAATFLLIALSACWPVRGRPPALWVPIALGWLRAARPRISHRPEDGTVGRSARPGQRAAGDLASSRSQRSQSSQSSSRLSRSRRRVRREAALLPAPLVGLEVIDLPGSEPIGVLRDARAGTWAAVLRVRGRSFSLLDPDDKERRLAAYGAMLAGLGRAGSPVHRLQWVERSLPGIGDGLARYFEQAGVGAFPAGADAGGVASCEQSYRQLIARAGPASQDHEVLVVLAVHARRSAKTIRAYGRGTVGVGDLLRREMRLLQAQLRQIDLAVTGPLRADQLLATLRSACGSDRPGATDARPQRGSATLTGLGIALASHSGWSSYRTDGAWHATYWIAEWPRVEVEADFLAPVLLAAGRRAVSLTMAPVAPQQAIREVESARTAEVADEELRRRAGFLSSARRRRASDGVAQREAELADGHAQYRFSGYITVTGADRLGLEAACAEVEQAGHQAQLDLRRLYGQQEEAFTWTLPLARGLR